MTAFEFCSFHKCGYSYSCANQREFLEYDMTDNGKRIPVFSKFCAQHNRRPYDDTEKGEVWAFSDSDFDEVSESIQEHDKSLNTSEKQPCLQGTPLCTVKRVLLESLSGSDESSYQNSDSDSEAGLSQ